MKNPELLLVMLFMLISCEKEVKSPEVPPVVAPITEITQEAAALRSDFAVQLPKIRSMLDNSKLKRAQLASDPELEAIMSDLSAKSLKMLQGYGIQYADIAQYVDSPSDPRIAVFGMVFLALQEKSNLPETNTLKRASLYGTVLDCLGRSILGVTVSSLVFDSAGACSLSTVVGIFGRVACRTLGVIGAAIAVADFGDCMGWYELW